MAKKQLTIEEKLQAALVPAEEQPYKVPENWCWVRLSSVATVITGGTPSKKHPEYYGSEFPFFKPADLDNGRSIVEASEYLSVAGKSVARIIPAHSTAVCCIGTIGKCGYLEVDGATNQQINSMIPKIDPLYLYYYANTELFINQLWSKAVATTISIVNKSKMESNNVPLPPLAEQSRIVARIESLFAKLDEAKAKIQEVLDGADLRRAAILHQAFTGKLTEKWRKEKNISIADWKEKTLKDCCRIGSGGTPSRKNPAFYRGDIPWVKTGEINWNELYDTEEHISKEAIDNSSAKLYREGAVLVAMYGMGATRGRAAILRTNATTNQAVCALETKENLLNQFLFYYFMNNYWKIREKAVGGNQLNLSGKIIEKLEVKLPVIEEQQEIVRLLDNLLSREQSIVTACEEALTTIDTLKKSILARAFRGELGTNAPSESSAKELLQEILAS